MDTIKISTAGDFANYINGKIDGLNFYVKTDKPIEIKPEQIEMLCKLFLDKAHEWTNEFIKVLLNDILKKPCSDNGKIYEALVYSWLDDHGIKFVPQVKVLSEDCLMKNDYEADGIIQGNIYFDVKKFGITLPHLDTLKRKLQEKVEGSYFVTVSGTKNISTRDLNAKYMSKLSKLVDEIMSDENKVKNGYKLTDKDSRITISLHDEVNEKIFTSISEFNPYEWAKNNELHFMNHASQFCLNSPYIIICPFDDSCLGLFANYDKNEVYDMLRPLCRRIFINLVNFRDMNICKYDKKAKKGISISTASRKISGIVFLDVSKEYHNLESRIWAFLNPNADNKISDLQVDQLFKYNCAMVDDFRFDNY